jgi:SAM-dependent methyltransferase
VTTHRDRRGVFGEAADDYDALRPSYPERMVDDVVAAAGPGPALEIGAGTGKASVAFAARGVELTCLEPDPRMAARLHRNVPGVEVVSARFESWAPDRRYDLIYSGQAWHWIDPERRNGLAHAALAPGGLAAMFWNSFLLEDRSLHAELSAIDARHIPDAVHTGHGWLAEEEARGWDVFVDAWPELTPDDGLFTDLDTRRYRWSTSYSSADYVRYLLTTSLYRLLDPAAQNEVLAGIAAAIDRRGGTISFVVYTDVAMARRVPD